MRPTNESEYNIYYRSVSFYKIIILKNIKSNNYRNSNTYLIYSNANNETKSEKTWY